MRNELPIADDGREPSHEVETEVTRFLDIVAQRRWECVLKMNKERGFKKVLGGDTKRIAWLEERGWNQKKERAAR